ncbi:MAG: DUF2130 domain-containing protein [Flavobacteriaceae bacterium]|nr:DUF2130 domain-containing protein [Flavobacteriaceae bacterium]
MKNNTQISCPNCGTQIDVNDLLKHQLEDSIRKEFKEKELSIKKDLEAKEEKLIQEKIAFENKKKRETEEFQYKLDTKLKEELKAKERVLKLKLQDENSERFELLNKELNEKSEKLKELNKSKAVIEKLKREKEELADDFKNQLEVKLMEELKAKEAKIKAKILDENSERIDLLNKELDEKSEKLKELNKSKAKIARLIREKEEIESKAKAAAEIVLNEKLKEEAIKIKKAAEEVNELKFKEYEKQLADQKELMEQMKRKHEQGSMQLQGEVQELAIEEWLADNFPLDSISEIKKGARGADCLQTVNTREQQNCGTIYYESKRTKDFQPAWIEKFKNDIRDKNANIGVLVTEVMPKEMKRMGLKDGIWICTFEEFKALSNVLRQSVIKLSNTIIAQENKGDKMAMLYDFLTSNEFKLQMEGIVEGFTQMNTDLQKEKNAMKRIWKQREKQIEKVIDNTINMYGSIKGIAGNAIQSINTLELPGMNE